MKSAATRLILGLMVVTAMYQLPAASLALVKHALEVLAVLHLGLEVLNVHKR